MYEIIQEYLNEILLGSGSLGTIYVIFNKYLDNPIRNLQKVVKALEDTPNIKNLTLEQVNYILQQKQGVKWDAGSRKRSDIS